MFVTAILFSCVLVSASGQQAESPPPPPPSNNCNNTHCDNQCPREANEVVSSRWCCPQPTCAQPSIVKPCTLVCLLAVFSFYFYL